MRLLAATGNRGKLREIEGLLAGSGIELVPLSELDDPPVVEEDRNTFAANACKKATVLAAHSGLLTMADDSGLMVAALDGRPGVFSARYAGEPSDDRANNAKLLQDLKEVPDAQRQAAFHCVIALAWPDGRCRTFNGEVPGRILSLERGSGGFGYDPLFLVPEYGLTMAELPLEIKNRISHRGRALRQLIPVLKEMAGQPLFAPGSA